jgi:hypothetical protein
VATDCETIRTGSGEKASAFSPLSWLALSTELGRLPLREGPSPSLFEVDEGRSTSRDMRLSSSALLSARLGTGDTIC